MLLVSQNIENYEVELPKNVIFRINMAWCNSIVELDTKLKKQPNSKFFIDLPIGRIKPPNNRYSLEEIVPIIESNNNVEFFAISNVESENDLIEFQNKLPIKVNLVPKIESPTAIKNLDNICKSLKHSEKFLMLDHDDLFSSMIRNKENPENFSKYIEILVDYCNKNRINLLRTVGVVFSDDEKRLTQYQK